MLVSAQNTTKARQRCPSHPKTKVARSSERVYGEKVYGERVYGERGHGERGYGERVDGERGYRLDPLQSQSNTFVPVLHRAWVEGRAARAEP